MMQNFLGKILLLAGGLRERPLNERRALFFTSFLVLGTLVLAFWANHMYRQFGVAFGGSGLYEREAMITRGQGSQENILSPLAAIRENAEVIKNETVDLFSVISNRMQELSGLTRAPAAGGEQETTGSKEPPVVVVKEQGRKEPAPTVAVIKKEKQVPAPVKTEEKVISKSAPVGAVLRQAEDGDRSLTILEKSAPAEPPRPKEDSAVPPPAGREAKRSRIVLILATNLVSIRQAFADFYDYLTH